MADPCWAFHPPCDECETPQDCVAMYKRLHGEAPEERLEVNVTLPDIGNDGKRENDPRQTPSEEV